MLATRFVRDQRGAIAIITAITLIPALLFAGVAIDYGRAHYVRTVLQAAADAAALAGAAASKNRAKVAKAYFAEKVAQHSLTASASSKIKASKGEVRVMSTMAVPTTLMGLAGIDSVDVNVSAVASSSRGDIELVIALDATTSMSSVGSRKQAYNAIAEVIGEVFDTSNNQRTYAALLPFSDRVVIPMAYEGWLSGVRPKGWRGCVLPREETIGGFSYALDDDPPEKEAFQYTAPEADRLNKGGAVCIEPFAGPTRNRAAIDDLVSNVWNDGTGRYDVAMAWGWRLLSPKWKGKFGESDYPADYGKKRKVLAVITDFKTAAYLYEVRPDKSSSNHYNAPFDATPIGRDHILDLCERIKETGIELWLIGVNEHPENIEYFQQCAGTRYIRAGSLETFTSALRKAAGLGTARLTK